MFDSPHLHFYVRKGFKAAINAIADSITPDPLAVNEHTAYDPDEAADFGETATVSFQMEPQDCLLFLSAIQGLYQRWLTENQAAALQRKLITLRAGGRHAAVYVLAGRTGAASTLNFTATPRWQGHADHPRQ